MYSKGKEASIPLPFLAFILLISLLVISGGFLLYNSQKNKVLSEKQNEMAAVSSLKIEEITKWRMEHIRDGKIISRIIPDKLNFSLLVNNMQPELRQELLQRMEAFMENYDYHSIFLIDSSGVVRLTYPPDKKNLNISFPASELNDSNNSGISLSNLHFSDDLPGMIHIDVQVPLFSSDGKKFGTMIMRVDPYKTLYPLIQSWPTPSKSSETLIVNLEDDSLVYMNDLRHSKNTALKFKLPLTNKDLPASAAISGYEGVFEGKDYRGIPVVSFLRKVPDSPWFMVAKIDKNEIYSPLKEQIYLIASVVFLFILSLIIFSIYYWRKQHIQYLKELNATKDKFFSIVSHDLKTPFISINGFANILIENVQNKDLSKAEKYTEIILGSSQNAIDLLSNLTEWSRLQTNRISFNPKEIDISSIVREVTELMNAPAQQKSITINTGVPAGLKIYADKEMLGTILRNLISNSIKFSNPGGRIDISVIRKKDEVMVEVKDLGTGMKKDLIDKLFRIEETVSLPGTLNENGTGLGLILVKEFVSLHGGKIWVESEFGKGSRFIFSLPL